MMDNTMFVFGGTGFIGYEVVTQAAMAGWHVTALVRSEEAAYKVKQKGANPVLGDISQVDSWIGTASENMVLIDLTQPKFPRRLGRSAIMSISSERQAMMRVILAGLESLPANQRPIFFSVSGADDLQPDEYGRINEHSLLRSSFYGFSHIGIPVRRLVETSGIEAEFIYFGNLVYGPGKIFVDQFINGLRHGAAFIIGRGTNHLPLVHVTDAARALVHLAGLPREEVKGRSFIVMDGADTTLRDLLYETAALMGVKRPARIPAWLAALVAGSIAVETITLDVHADPSALLATGYHFQYPSYKQGVPSTLSALGYASHLPAR
jgi:2-alkyl-3-oxoalkanoate reductase